MVNAKLAGILTAALIIGALPAHSQTPPPDPAAGEMFGKEPAGPAKPTPRTPDGHPDLNGYWKGLRTTKPVGNIGKDLPGFKLPFTPEGEAAWKHNVTATYDPEALCIPGGIPRHNASGLPFMVMQTPKLVAFLYFYSYHRYIPVDGRKHSEDPDPSFFGEEIGHWEGDTLVIDSIGAEVIYPVLEDDAVTGGQGRAPSQGALAETDIDVQRESLALVVPEEVAVQTVLRKYGAQCGIDSVQRRLLDLHQTVQRFEWRLGPG